jgi:hypothetical protein
MRLLPRDTAAAETQAVDKDALLLAKLQQQ